MTPLADLLVRRIRANGPITLADYMAECLLHPQYGYYATRDPFGAPGDFTTAPEISQMFGELLGLCLAQAWLDQGAPARFTLAELGPGRGTLMADVLRATKGVPGFHGAADVLMVEASATLRKRQRASLGDHPARWADHLPQGETPLYLLANEFFDALPIRQFTRQPQGWAETLIGIAQDRLSMGKSAAAPISLLDHRLADTKPGDVVELCPSAPALMESIARQIEAHGGVALILDYGDWTSRGDTFQALKAHQFADPLAEPGEADLTAHVDFAALAAPCKACAYTTQGQLLTALGIHPRAARIGQRLSGDALTQHNAATHRLTAPAEMGRLFKALAVYPSYAPKPPGIA
ncbi:MAG: SAM-dependent methyltransferase [Cypionkella sp.]|uniref:class I SAM-dependent methyltransferase n=1 Tax=Cypionkella sp. TaxID=2811411 RepID=UPI002AB8AA87|nr:SAM-dependent methyltransferase [Cypionkella sp.]MDZ4309712.1 SAM-dependent methyltransferase [Cypionkella sp.]MDZ4394659.1 SAM-dependent methyltransferase [Cypionkella sp.]